MKIKKYLILFVFILGFLEVFRFFGKFTPFIDRSLVFPNTPALEYLEQQKMPYRTTGAHTVPINLRMNYGIPSLEGYDAVYPERISKFLTVLNGQDPNANSLGRYGFVNNEASPLLNIANVDYVLTTKEMVGNFDRNYDVVNINEPELYVLKNKNSLPNSFFVYKWEVDSESDVLEKLSNNFDYKNILLLTKAPTIAVGKSGKGEVNIEGYFENKILMKVSTNYDGMLFSSDTFYPGWKAYVDGIQTKIYEADYAFRAIEVSKGEHTVTYEYRPESFYLGLKVSIITFLVLMLLNFLPLLKRKI